jgi:hypothetical protein
MSSWAGDASRFQSGFRPVRRRALRVRWVDLEDCVADELQRNIVEPVLIVVPCMMFFGMP